jgi:uncharacterized HAD superfamily protein
MKIAIDIDDTLVKNCESLINTFNKKFGKNLRVEENTSDKRFHEFLGITKEELLDFYKEHDEIVSCEEIIPLEGANHFLGQLKEKHHLFLVTSRPENVRADTHLMIDRHFPNHGIQIIFVNSFNGKKISKGEFCKQEGISLMIDDDYKNALSCVENNVSVLLLDKPWNKGIEHKLITRVYSWQEIFDKIKELESK